MKNDDMFYFNGQQKIMIYGAASAGGLLYEKLMKSGMNVISFVDKRADEILKFHDLPVLSIGELEQVDKDTVIVIAVKNIFQHDKIVNDLTKNGFNNIIYMPRNSYEGNGFEKIKYAYNKLSFGESVQKYIPKTYGVPQDILKDWAICGEDKDKYKVYVPSDLIYSYNTNLPWANIPISAYFPHFRFFRFLNGSNRSNDFYEDYINFCEFSARSQGDVKITRRWKKNILENRENINNEMNHSLELDSRYLINNAPEAKWNVERKYFNLISGKHRATWYLSKGYNFLPLKIDKEDYDKWKKAYQNDLLLENINRNLLDQLDYFIPHPFLYKIDYRDKRIVEIFGQFVTEYMAAFSMKNSDYPRPIKILCRSRYFINVALKFKKCGYNVKFFNTLRPKNHLEELEQTVLGISESDFIDLIEECDFLLDDSERLKNVETNVKRIFFVRRKENAKVDINIEEQITALSNGELYSLFLEEK